MFIPGPRVVLALARTEWESAAKEWLLAPLLEARRHSLDSSASGDVLGGLRRRSRLSLDAGSAPGSECVMLWGGCWQQLRYK